MWNYQNLVTDLAAVLNFSKKILQNLSNGKTTLVDVPCPKIKDGSLLIETSKTIVSVGTERMLVDFGKANILNKARQQPDKVKMVLNKVQTDGLFSTISSIRTKLDKPIELGYCNAGVIIESSVDGFLKGDRVVSNGHHAEVTRVSKNLCALIPDEVDDETAEGGGVNPAHSASPGKDLSDGRA